MMSHEKINSHKNPCYSIKGHFKIYWEKTEYLISSKKKEHIYNVLPKVGEKRIAS